ncbi:MAG: PepSY-associated TM helix domain-containing protein [Janthinobacterium lividum]
MAATPGARPVGAGSSGTTARRRGSRYGNFVKWLRKAHGWLGLWGAAFGLMFGTTGFFLNHRGGPLKVSTGVPIVSSMQLPLPTPAPNTPAELTAWLKDRLALQQEGRSRRERGHTVEWGDQTVEQPEHWTINFAGPRNNVQAEYWVGSQSVSVKRSENTLLAALTNLHKGVGLSVPWVLLIDTLAGSLILLSLTGLVLWIDSHKPRTVAYVLVGGSLLAIVVCAMV